MTTLASSAWWFVRIDCSGNRHEEIKNLLEKYSESTLWVQEDPDRDSHNSHYHFTLKYEKALSKDTARERLKKALPDIKGNGDYNLKVLDIAQIDEVYKYMCKGSGPDWDTGQPNVHLNRGVDVRAFHTAFWKKNKEIKKNKASNFSTECIITRVIVAIEAEQNPAWKADELTRGFFRRICDEVLKQSSGRLYPNQSTSIISAVVYKFYPTDREKTFFQQNVSKYFPEQYL